MPAWRVATALKFPPKFTHKPLHFGGFVLFWWDFFLLSTAVLLRFTGGYSEHSGLNTCMRLSEITGPKTPDQLRMDTLRATQKRASNAVKMERNRQKVQSAQKAIQQLRAPKPTTLEPIKPMGSH